VACVAVPFMIPGANSTFLLDWGQSNQTRLIQIFVAVLFGTSLAAGLALAQQERLKRLLVRREQLTRAARARALAATEAKTEFLATMSHEIRTPLNSVLGFAQLLAARKDLPPDVRRQVNLIDSAGGALLTVVNDILDFSRVEAGQVELLPSRPRRRPCCATRWRSWPRGPRQGPDPGGGGHRPGRRPARPGRLRLRQVLLNLLNNAVKFTEAGRIRAPDRRARRSRTGCVRDHRHRRRHRGRAAAPAVPALLQVDSSASRTYGGAGLGLAISKALVELMGGKIGVDSVPGRGSCFWIEMQAPPVEASPSPSVASPPRPARPASCWSTTTR
jgi:signal transduction histidine kinase